MLRKRIPDSKNVHDSSSPVDEQQQQQQHQPQFQLSSPNSTKSDNSAVSNPNPEGKYICKEVCE